MHLELCIIRKYTVFTDGIAQGFLSKLFSNPNVMSSAIETSIYRTMSEIPPLTMFGRSQPESGTDILSKQGGNPLTEHMVSRISNDNKLHH